MNTRITTMIMEAIVQTELAHKHSEKICKWYFELLPLQSMI